MKMKKTYVVLAGLFLFVFLGAIGWLVFSGPRYEMTGRFEYEHEITVWGLKDKGSCEGKGGRLSGEGSCIFNAVDEVAIRKVGEETRLSISTVGENAGYCKYDAVANEQDGTFIKSIIQTSAQEKTSSDVIHFTCEVGVEFLSNNQIRVRNNGNCTEFCKKKVQLTIGKANRVN